MPGVPTGRGCRACRKLKKKCDQLIPSCSRCRRLRIDCVGSGQQRFKFVEQMTGTQSQAVLQRRSLSRTPSNEITAMADALMSALEIKDPRYNIGFYGEFFRDIPRRLGTHDALDASVVALTNSLSLLYTGQKSTDALVAYGRALKALRICMGDPVKAQTPDTLCAIFLIMVCHSWIGKYEEQVASHGEAMSIVLDAATSRVWSGDFERQILIMSAISVIFESFSNSRVQLHPWLDRILSAYGQGGGTSPFPSISLRGLWKVSDFLRNPLLNLLGMRYTYQQMKADLQKLRALLIDLTGSPSHAQCQAVLGVLLALIVIVNRLLQVFDSHDASLVEEMGSFCTEILILGEQAMQHRPLGASYMRLSLSMAWVGTEDTSRRAEIRAMLSDYQTDFEVVHLMERLVWLEEVLEGIRQRLLRSQLENPRDDLGGVVGFVPSI